MRTKDEVTHYCHRHALRGDHRQRRSGEGSHAGRIAGAGRDVVSAVREERPVSLSLLERDGVIERASHPDGRIKAMRLTARGRRALEVARPLWAQAQGKVLR